jgi:hypothetical protein
MRERGQSYKTSDVSGKPEGRILFEKSGHCIMCNVNTGLKNECWPDFSGLG